MAARGAGQGLTLTIVEPAPCWLLVSRAVAVTVWLPTVANLCDAAVMLPSTVCMLSGELGSPQLIVTEVIVPVEPAGSVAEIVKDVDVVTLGDAVVAVI